MFPGYNEPESPFHDKRVRQAVSLAINREFLVRQETDGVGKVWGNWISPENRDALKGDGKDPVPEFNVEKAKQLLAQAGFPNGFEFEWFVPFVPYFDMGERILTDLRAVGIRGKLQSLEGPAFRAKIGQGRKGFPGNRTIVQKYRPSAGGCQGQCRHLRRLRQPILPGLRAAHREIVGQTSSHHGPGRTGPPDQVDPANPHR